jgi:hypothetical protein
MLGIEVEIGDNLLVLLMAAIPTIPAIVAAILSYRSRKELKPNGGESIHDKVNSLHRVIVSHDRKEDAPTDPVVIIDKKGATDNGSNKESAQPEASTDN